MALQQGMKMTLKIKIQVPTLEDQHKSITILELGTIDSHIYYLITGN